MSFFWKHKIFSVCIILVAAYWFNNPANRFGYVRKGLAVYNRIPVIRFDVYIDVEGKMTLEEDVRDDKAITYLLTNKIPSEGSRGRVQFIVGTGFDPAKPFKLDRDQEDKLESMGRQVTQLPTLQAISRYNGLRDAGKRTSILLRLN